MVTSHKALEKVRVLFPGNREGNSHMSASANLFVTPCSTVQASPSMMTFFPCFRFLIVISSGCPVTGFGQLP